MTFKPMLRDAATLSPSLIAKLVVAAVLSLAVVALVPKTVSSGGTCRRSGCCW